MLLKSTSTIVLFIILYTCILLSVWQVLHLSSFSISCRSLLEDGLFSATQNFSASSHISTIALSTKATDLLPLSVLKPIGRPQCVSVRFRGENQSYSVVDAELWLSEKDAAAARPRRWGFLFLEEIDRFFPVRVRPTGNQYHMYHYVEILIIAYSQWQLLSPADSTVNWILSPYMSPSELCGGINAINCLIADMVLQGSNRSIFQNHSGVLGLQDMEQYRFDPARPKDKALERRRELFHKVYGSERKASSSSVSSDLLSHADAVLVVQRSGCNPGGINKPWLQYIDSFPSAQWHADVMRSLGRPSKTDVKKRRGSKLVVGYIDRQNTLRQLLDVHHQWLLQYFGSHDKVDFRHLHMEEYSPFEQIQHASECDVLLGVHGNGLTHSLWMAPQRYVVEFFWNFNFQYDYATTAQLMNHTYLGLWNGQVLDGDRVRRRDPLLRQEFKKEKPTEKAMDAFDYEGRVAIQKLVEGAMRDLNVE